MKNNTLTIFAIIGAITLLAGVGLALLVPRWIVSANGGGPKNAAGQDETGNWQSRGWDADPMGQGMGRSAAQQAGRVGQRGRGGMNGDPTGLASLSAAETEGLQQAILEEYGALNLYQAVIDQLGAQSPFTEIVRSEQQHVSALVRQAEKYSVTVPANPGLSEAPAFTTLTEACAAGIQAETADAALYDQLKQVTTNSSLLRVYDRLQSASLNSHLPAFQACQ